MVRSVARKPTSQLARERAVIVEEVMYVFTMEVIEIRNRVEHVIKRELTERPDAFRSQSDTLQRRFLNTHESEMPVILLDVRPSPRERRVGRNLTGPIENMPSTKLHFTPSVICPEEQCLEVLPDKQRCHVPKQCFHCGDDQ